MCSSLYQAQIAECGAKSEGRENKEEERQTEREGFNRRFMHVFILKRTEGTCSFKANKSCGNITKTYFRHYGSKRFFSLYCLLRILSVRFQVEQMWDLIFSHLSNQGNGPSSVHKNCQNKPIMGYTRIWYTLPNPDFAKKYHRRSFALTPRPNPLADFPAHLSLRRTIWTPGTGIWTPGTGKCLTNPLSA